MSTIHSVRANDRKGEVVYGGFHTDLLRLSCADWRRKDLRT
jgi:hypothetical protein